MVTFKANSMQIPSNIYLDLSNAFHNFDPIMLLEKMSSWASAISDIDKYFLIIKYFLKINNNKENASLLMNTELIHVSKLSLNFDKSKYGYSWEAQKM